MAGRNSARLGFQGTMSDVAAIWARNARHWQMRLPPWRPSRDDIEHYRELSASFLHGNILILGATPELRAIAASGGGKVTIMDICPDMVTAANTLLPGATCAQENVKISDWCEMPFRDNSFDIVMGDLFWWLLSIRRQGILSRQIRRALKGGGVFVTRAHFYEPQLFKKNIGLIIDEYVSRLSTTESGALRISEELAAVLLDSTTDTNKQRHCVAQAIRALDAIALKYEKNSIKNRFLKEFSEQFSKRTNWTSQNKDQLISSLTRDFTIAHETHSDDYENARLYPIFTLQKNDPSS